MIPRDKILHVLAGAAIAACVSPWGYAAAFMAVCAIGIAKEVVIDAAGRGTRDPLDALATIAGGALVLGWLLAVDKWAGL